MRSGINKLVDYRNVPMEWEVTVSCPQEHIQKELRMAVRKHKTVVQVETVEKGAVVMLKLQSDCPRYNKAMVPVTVGSDLFDPALEKSCLGRKVGQTFCTETESGGVTVTVLKASRTLYPEPTDQMVEEYGRESEEYAGLTTVEAFVTKVRADYCDQLRDSAVYEKMNMLMDAVLEQSDWAFDPEDVSAMHSSSMQEIRVDLREQMGKTLEELSEKELTGYFGVRSLEELEQVIQADSERWIAIILWCAHEQNRTPSLKDMETLDFKFVEDFVRSKIVCEEVGA